MWLAGGGVKGGMAYGATDEFGFAAVENRMHVHDLHATILHLMGIDHEQLTYRYSGRDFRLTDVSGHGRARDPGVESSRQRPCLLAVMYRVDSDEDCFFVKRSLRPPAALCPRSWTMLQNPL